MRKIIFFIIFILNIGIIMPNEITRKSQISGSFYPKNVDELRNLITSYLDLADVSKISNLKNINGIVVPHAGYVFSGSTAAFSYKAIQNNIYDLAVIIAPSHQKYFSGVSVFDGNYYETPLGKIKVDKEFASKITNNNQIKLSSIAHITEPNQAEHSLEVQLPFLQTVQPNLPIVPIIIGSQDFSTVNILVRNLYSAIKNEHKKVLLIASSDLSHFHNLNEANELDKSFINAFTSYNYFKLELNTFAGNWEACGSGPISIVMQVCELLGSNRAIELNYSTSANSKYANYDKTRVVGYFSGVIGFDEAINSELLPKLSTQDMENSLLLAKSSIEQKINNKPFKNNLTLSEKFESDYPVFVTINKQNSKGDFNLRACMGHIISSNNLKTEILSTATMAATDDYRFGPIKVNELDSLKYEITILSRFKKILNINEIKIGKNGLYLRNRNKSALFLPQVATDNNWNIMQFLQNLCYKANLPIDAYTNPDTELFIFEAVIID